MATKRSPTWAEVINNALMKLISTGQLPLVLLLLVIGFLVYRTPPENTSQVWVALVQLLDRRSGLGYGLGLLSSAGWAIHSRYQRRKFEKELERVSEERNQAQQLHFNRKLDSSKKR
jgi:drug/metabolite transporter (DMT)-like permease